VLNKKVHVLVFYTLLILTVLDYHVCGYMKAMVYAAGQVNYTELLLW